MLTLTEGTESGVVDDKIQREWRV